MKEIKTRKLSASMKEKGYKTFFTDFQLFSREEMMNRTKEMNQDLNKRFKATEQQALLYFLYDDGELFYTGKASRDGWSRIKAHIKTKPSWDQVLLLKTKKRYLSALEGLIIAVTNTQGNIRKEKIVIA